MDLYKNDSEKVLFFVFFFLIISLNHDWILCKSDSEKVLFF